MRHPVAAGLPAPALAASAAAVAVAVAAGVADYLTWPGRAGRAAEAAAETVEP
ncbi:MAG: hypothetical protein ACLQDY_09445 [Streptosporangiaceae bacterium]